MARTVVILGGSYTGVETAHHLLKHVAPAQPGLKVVLVSPNTHFLWVFAMVRGILPETMGFPDDKLLYPLAPAFACYPASQFEHVLGAATALDPATSKVTVVCNKSADHRHQVEIPYDFLVVARDGLPFKQAGTTEAFRAALGAWRARIAAAETIVLAGAGATGTETMAEIATEYGGAKTVHFVVGGELPLSDELRRDVRETAKREIERLGAKVVVNTRVTSVSRSGDKTIVKLAGPDGAMSTLEVDLFLPAYGVVPNTRYLPPSMRDAHGRAKQTLTLQAEGHANIFVVGDAGNLEAPTGQNADKQVRHLQAVLDAHIAGRPLPEYKVDTSIRIRFSLGRRSGTGQVGNWSAWGFLVAWLKSKALHSENAQGVVEGRRSVLLGKW